MERTTCCVVGGGPAGMVLGLLLARSGVDVTVLEKHGDFLRDFRGDTVHPTTLQLLDDLGLAERFAALPQRRIQQVRLPIGPGGELFTFGDFGLLPIKYNYIAMVPQWDFLDLLAAEGAREPHFTLRMNTEAVGLIRERGRVNGVRYRTADGTTGTVKTDKDGKTEAEAKISNKAVEDAKKSSEAVKVPTEVKAGKDSNSAPTVKVELPKNAGETKIEIPVSNVNSGTVAVIVHEDGTEEIVKNSKPTEDGVQLTVDGNTVVKIIDNSKDFIDTRNHWSRDEVNFVASRDIFNGVGNNLFGVSQPMTRGMVNTVLARLAGIDTTPKNGQKWYEVGTEWAKSKGITDGTNPEASVTREQLATLLYRFYGSPAISGTLRFADAGAVSAYAQDALLWATQNGIMNGVGNNCVAPSADAQRAQVAAMMARYLKNAD